MLAGYNIPISISLDELQAISDELKKELESSYPHFCGRATCLVFTNAISFGAGAALSAAELVAGIKNMAPADIKSETLKKIVEIFETMTLIKK